MFEILTPLHLTVRTSEAYWQKLIVKHPDIAELCDLVQVTLRDLTKFVAAATTPTFSCFIDRTVKAAGSWPLPENSTETDS
jgi:hypothetical protein